MPLNQELAKYYQKLLKLAEKITKGNKVDAQDLVQDLYVIILEYDQEKIKKIVENGHLVFWSARDLMNQYVRTNSAFKTKYYTKLRTENYDDKNFQYYDVIEESVEIKNKLSFFKDKMKNLYH